MTVRDNMAFGLKLRKLAKSDIEKRVNEAASILSLDKLLDRKPKELSGGQRQRVALGRAIVREPAVFLMDEPLSNLDAKLRVQTRAEIARLHQRMGTTFVYVTHDQVEAMTMGTRIAVMSDGIIMQVGSPQELYDRPANRFVAGFIGSPSMNFVEVTADNGKLVGPGGWVAELPGRLKNAVGAVNGRKLEAGFRPEHLELGTVEGETVTIPGKADVVEYLGNEELLHVSGLGRDIVAIVESDHRVKPGDVLELILPYSKLHLFDLETGESLISEREAVPA
jgi:multiple sugar transport system ATP-binding protein